MCVSDTMGTLELVYDQYGQYGNPIFVLLSDRLCCCQEGFNSRDFEAISLFNT